MIILCWTAVTLSLHVITCVDSYMEKQRKEQDEALYPYCLNRLLVICPHCRIGFEVQDLSEQMNVEWHCECCHRDFVEYATHTR